MSNWCNRNTIEYLISQNDPDYVGLPEWFIVAVGSMSESNLLTFPRRYLFVPEGTDDVVEKSQDGKDQADANLQALQEAQARQGATDLTNSTLDPNVMSVRAGQQVDTDDLNAQIQQLNDVLLAAAAAPGFANFKEAIITGIPPSDPLTEIERQTQAQAKIAAGDTDAPAI